MKNGLIITDIQNDFCPGGALAVAEGDRIIPAVNAISARFDKCVATQDWHPPGHVSFASTHGKKPFEVISVDGRHQELWPDHCVPGTSGADFHKDLDTRPVDLIIRKGSDPRIDSYSTFMENDRETLTGLHYYLRGMGIGHLYFCGLATDYCVHFSAIDALRMGFEVTILLDACRGVDVPAANVERAVSDMRDRGVHVLSGIDFSRFVPG
ncbi:MAG: bifunctional nicotinamidase/pyrazinamidase [Deltaproteobacteria bacterium]|nr:bifunctional nicotinamidase/pyrazinamidase [Deltaproteobacteria bacterium]